MFHLSSLAFAAFTLIAPGGAAIIMTGVVDPLRLNLKAEAASLWSNVAAMIHVAF